MINLKSKIYVAGHKGLVGSAIIRQLKKSKKPVIILGGGIKYAKAEKKLRIFFLKVFYLYLLKL